ncbi:MAG: NAD(P)H-hydrate dehydratase [Bacteroidia bacterium]
MKKILDANHIRQADAYTIEHEPVSSLLLMERAAHGCFQWLRKHYGDKPNVKIFCGTGNNGGDGLVIADYLLAQNINVKVYIVRYSDQCSNDFSVNENRLLKNYADHVFNIHNENELPSIDSNDLVIDALFGTGLSKPPQGIAAQVIQHINLAQVTVVAIDMPSGLFADVTSITHSDAIIKAKYTLTFQFKKRCFYYPESFPYCGDVEVIDIKLHQKFVSACSTHFYETEQQDIQQIIKPRNTFSHKGTYGHALLMCGSYGKIGAAVLSSKACLRSGVGLLTVNVPQCGYEILQTAVPEAMVIADEEQQVLCDEIDYNHYDAIGIGCGIGTDVLTIKLLKHLLGMYKKPMVIDADALNIISYHKELLYQLPAGCILTPHVKEFARLTKYASDDFERNALQRELSAKYNCYVILKGKYSCVSTPEGDCYFNPTGNAGMATGGSGDVLTGILTGLFAQGYTPYETCIAGAYLHGAAGDAAAAQLSVAAMIASDITSHLGNAFLNIS